MPLNEGRKGEIALSVLQHTWEAGGSIKLNPAEAKRQVANFARKFKIQPHEAAEFLLDMMTKAYRATAAELESIKDPADEKKK